MLRKLDAFCLQHWHGILQRHTNFVDGTVGVTQCPLVPNESFEYKFNANDQAVNISSVCHEIFN